MDNDLLKTILGSGGMTVVIVALLTLVSKLWQNYKAEARAEDMDEASWNASFKSGAERHVLGYDVPMHHAVLDLQYEVNKLRSQIGEEQKQFGKLPDPRDFPLFPDRDTPLFRDRDKRSPE